MLCDKLKAAPAAARGVSYESSKEGEVEVFAVFLRGCSRLRVGLPFSRAARGGLSFP